MGIHWRRSESLSYDLLVRCFGLLLYVIVLGRGGGILFVTPLRRCWLVVVFPIFVGFLLIRLALALLLGFLLLLPFLLGGRLLLIAASRTGIRLRFFWLLASSFLRVFPFLPFFTLTVFLPLRIRS